MKCVRKRFKKQLLCAGDLDKFIVIQERAITPVAPGTLEPVETFTTIKSVWAAVENDNKILKTFDGVNIGGNLITEQVSHAWFIYFDPDLNLETGNNFIFYDGKRYKIIGTINPGEDNNFLTVLSKFTGIEEKKAAQA